MPYEPHPPTSTEMIKQWAGTAFNFALYFQEPGMAEAELEADVRRSLLCWLHSISVPKRSVEASFTLSFSLPSLYWIVGNTFLYNDFFPIVERIYYVASTGLQLWNYLLPTRDCNS